MRPPPDSGAEAGQGLFDRTGLAALGELLDVMDAQFADLPPVARGGDTEHLVAVLRRVAARLGDNLPYPHPLYAGQMLKPPHPVARLAYLLAMWINPNNHALDGGRASSAMEKEAVAAIARLYGWDTHLGHLTSGGTVANLEALWIAGSLHPDRLIVASTEAHYTHSRLTAVLRQPFEALPTDAAGRLSLAAVEALAREGRIGTVVATVGTTGAGAVDPLRGLIDLARRYGFRIHADAAYGGYFGLADNLGEEARAAYDCLGHVDSIVVDPHKHGLQPYGCGCILFRDPAVGRFYQHDSPYTYFSSAELHLGEISLECSRAGAAAVALWATQQLLPMDRDGEFANLLSRCRSAALALAESIDSDSRYWLLQPPELDIVVWAVRAAGFAESSARARSIFEAAAARDLHLALIEMPPERLPPDVRAMRQDRDTLLCLRSCLIKPEHGDWMDEIRARLDAAGCDALGSAG